MGISTTSLNDIIRLVRPPTPKMCLLLALHSNGLIPAIETLVEAQYLDRILWRHAPRTPHPNEKRKIKKFKNPKNTKNKSKPINVINAYI